MRIVLLLFYLVLASNAAPSLVRSSRILARQNPSPFDGPVTVTTTSTFPTSIGTLTQTCQVTLTPVTINGINAVREDKVCKNVLDASGGSNISSSNNDQSSSTSTSTSTTSSSESTSSVQTGSNNNNNGGGGSGNVVSPSDVSVIGTGLVSGSSTITAGSTAPTANAGGTGGGPIVIGQSTITGAATTATSAGTGAASVAADNNGSTTSAAESQASSPAPFQIPGKKLQVLPIGLGVFAGISVIALIVVGLVTYERTKYRKTFRQRKLAESAAPMGYGGMAERT